MLTQIMCMLPQAKNRISFFARDERGDFGIGQIAAIVAGIVIIGVVVTTITGRLPNWIDRVWEWISAMVR